MSIVINGSGTITGITAGGLPDGTIQQADLETLVVPVGVNQTWQVVTGSRAAGTTYTNSTGRPITVSVTVVSNGSYQLDTSLTVAGTVIQYVSAVTAGQTTSAKIPLTAIVPNGSTYLVTTTTGSVHIWSELR